MLRVRLDDGPLEGLKRECHVNVSALVRSLIRADLAELVVQVLNRNRQIYFYGRRVGPYFPD